MADKPRKLLSLHLISLSLYLHTIFRESESFCYGQSPNNSLLPVAKTLPNLDSYRVLTHVDSTYIQEENNDVNLCC